MRTEHSSPARDPLAVGVGVFIGCTPLFGLHLALSLAAATLLRLNRLKVYLAANISNPLFLPFLLFAEIQTGAWLRRGEFHALSREALTAIEPWQFGLDLVLGSLVVGVVLGVTMAALTHVTLRGRRADPDFDALAGRAAERYARTSLTAWEFASAKLRRDPIYRTAIGRDLLPGGDTLVDIGCGQGLTLALLVEAGRVAPSSRWTHYPTLIGVDTRPRVADLAREALADAGVTILCADARTTAVPACDAVLLFDVLHLVPRDAQVDLLVAVRSSLRPGGVVLVREADTTTGWRFALVRVGNRLKALLGGRWRQTFAFRSPDEWRECFARAGYRHEVFPGPATHPFGNTLFRLRSDE